MDTRATPSTTTGTTSGTTNPIRSTATSLLVGSRETCICPSPTSASSAIHELARLSQVRLPLSFYILFYLYILVCIYLRILTIWRESLQLYNSHSLLTLGNTLSGSMRRVRQTKRMSLKRNYETLSKSSSQRMPSGQLTGAP